MVDDAATRLRLARRDGCGHDRFFCADFGPVAEHRVESPPIEIERRHGGMVIRLQPSDASRIVMTSIWFREGWRANHPGVSVFPVFEQLTGIRIPAGVGEVRLGYWPQTRLWAHIAGAIVLLAGVVRLAAIAAARK